MAAGASWKQSLCLLVDVLPHDPAEFRREANFKANNGREWKDLYSSPFNALTMLIVLTILAPILGLVFAFQTYGKLWG